MKIKRNPARGDGSSSKTRVDIVQDRIKEIKGEAETLFQEFQEVEQKERRETEDSVRGILHQLRISGSAIADINPKVVPEWQQALDRFAEPYRIRLEELKERLRSLS